jgi:hypothetical protein
MVIFLAAGIACSDCLGAVNELRDPFFSSVPFERWHAEGKRKQIRWAVEFFPVELSVHQRLLARVRIEMDRDAGIEPAPRALAILIEYRDQSGGVWQTHILPGAGRERDSAGLQTVVFGNAFVRPGSYLVSVAVFDQRTHERSFVSHRIQAKAPSGDPLPHAWDELPAVEFLPPRADPPDEWFLPSITTHLALSVPTRRPVRLDVIVNATPGGNMAGSTSAVRRNMSVLIPSLKVVSRIEPEQGSVNVRLLDLVAHRTAFEQNEARSRAPSETQEAGDNWPALDWPRLRRFFIESRPGIIDARSLAWFWKMRSFFWDQVIAAQGASRGEARVVLILSGPAFFPGQEPFPQSETEWGQNAFVYYVRYRPYEFFPRRVRSHPGAHPFPASPAVRPMPDDELEIAARKLNARVFDVTSPAEFRRVVAAVMGQLAGL